MIDVSKVMLEASSINIIYKEWFHGFRKFVKQRAVRSCNNS